MTAEWVGVIISGALLVGGFLLFVVRLSMNVSGSLRENAGAIKTLTDYLEKQDKRNDEQDKKLEDHEVRIGNIETVHVVKGCINARP